MATAGQSPMQAAAHNPPPTSRRPYACRRLASQNSMQAAVMQAEVPCKPSSCKPKPHASHCLASQSSMQAVVMQAGPPSLAKIASFARYARVEDHSPAHQTAATASSRAPLEVWPPSQRLNRAFKDARALRRARGIAQKSRFSSSKGLTLAHRSVRRHPTVTRTTSHIESGDGLGE